MRMGCVGLGMIWAGNLACAGHGLGWTWGQNWLDWAWACDGLGMGLAAHVLGFHQAGLGVGLTRSGLHWAWAGLDII